MFYAVMLVKYRFRRMFGGPEMAHWGINMEFGRRYDQRNFRNEFPDHENLGIGTLIEFVCAIVSVLC